jgi:hypothetical protein
MRRLLTGLGVFVLPGLLLGLGALRCLTDQGRDVDVMLYSAAAVRANAEGALPYVAAWVEKGPLAMALYQLLFGLFGPYNMAALAGAWLALAAAGALLAFRLAREMGARSAAPYAPLLFAAAAPVVAGTLNTEMPAGVAAAAAVLFWCRSARPDPGGTGAPVTAGLFAAAGFLCRQNAGAVWPLLLAGEVSLLWTGRSTPRRALERSLAQSAGFLLPVVLTVAVYAAARQLDTFVFCFYSYNAHIYVAATKVDAARVLASPWTAFRQFLLPAPMAGLLGLLGCGLALGALGPRTSRAEPQRLAAALVAAAGLGLTLSLFLGLRLFTHYFGLALPFWCAAAALAAERLGGLLGPSVGKRSGVVVAAVVALGLATEVAARRPWSTVHQVARWIGARGLSSLADVSASPNRDPLAAPVGRLLRERSRERDRLFVWGMRPHLYVQAARVPATPFVTCTFLSGLVPWERSAPQDDTRRWIVPGAWDLLMRDLETDPPRFVLDASDDRLFGRGAYPPSDFPRLRAFLDARYEVVARESGGGDRVIVYGLRSGPATAARR